MTVEADDDDDAIAFLMDAAIGGLATVELWCGQRLVRRFDPDDLPYPPLADDLA